MVLVFGLNTFFILIFVVFDTDDLHCYQMFKMDGIYFRSVYYGWSSFLPNV